METSEKVSLSPPQPVRTRTTTSKTARRLLGLVLCACIVQSIYVFSHGPFHPNSRPIQAVRAHRAELVAKCHDIRTPAGPPSSFSTANRVREGSDRWVPGTPPTLIRNSKIWTGGRNGTEVVFGDVLLDKGLVVAVGYIPQSLLDQAKRSGEVNVLDAGGKWITPGLVDLHSHIGVNSVPHLRGAADGNSHKAPILPWLRSIDGLNTHDDSYEIATAGGVTTAQILPGSANNIGGQAFVIKLRPTAERSATSKVIEPPLTLTHSPNGTEYPRWRHMKYAFSSSENPDRVYSQTRMDGQWNFRNAYNEARKIRDKQDALCAKVESGDWAALEAQAEGRTAEFPEELQWESLVDVLRGRVKAVDLDGIVRLSNEFKFPVASFHHAGETYLVPDLLKKTYGGAPSIALFATNFRKKREAYRGSEFAPRVLAEHNIPVVMKSDHPVVNSRYLIYEAQLAHYYGLNPALALGSVTSVPASAAGLGHRIGTISEGYDADIVLWDSHPLTLGATPVQVYVDGVAQLESPFPLTKPAAFQDVPEVPNWDKEKEETIKWEGVPPLKGWGEGKVVGTKPESEGRVVIKNVKSLWRYDEAGEPFEDVFRDEGDVEDHVQEDGQEPEQKKAGLWRTVLVQNGVIVDSWDAASSSPLTAEVDADGVIDLRGGSIAPGLTTYGAPVGTGEDEEDDGIVRAVDGLAFAGRNPLLAYKAGVTTAITAPSGSGFLRGLGVAFSVGAPHALADGAIVQKETALHVALSFGFGASVSSQVAALRGKLFSGDVDDTDEEEIVGGAKRDLGVWERVREGTLPLVVSVESADIMSTLLALKSDYEESTNKTLKLTFSGATESHLLANEIAKAGVNVVLTQPRPFPNSWEQRRILPGPPLSKESSVTELLNSGVNVAVGVIDEASARNTRFDLAWIALESNGTISQAQALALATTNLQNALGLTSSSSSSASDDLVMYAGGGVLDFESKPVGVISASRKGVELF
ncbi:hypothetical protein CPB84DRAFT_1787269 [Gymnopilus junonius]|uniref:Amidohydrolase-related domain-containing protein n=1 Tax=Gymnopilus junonius TaxID=109634 RepID=A0A9P5TKS8_GYMJU|nr:hypothetical protein CPB84DRAFT_1787269 [Gymnopilus junonius]